jgi:23S rRNA (cytosine1962-C5)-methyltransferase
MNWRAVLPAPGERRIAVRATPDAVRQIKGGSPWLFDGSITSVSHEGAAGDLAVVFDERRNFVAVGLWDPGSPIRLKVLHAGSPATIDRNFWHRTLSAAIERRSTLAADATTTAYRCVHGENDGLPGLVVDRYDTTLVVKLYTPAWFAHLEDVVDALTALLAPEGIVLRLSRAVAGADTFGLRDGDTLAGKPPDGPILFRERGLIMEADVVHGQKTGHFLDQRDNRILVRGSSAGCDVLDVFCSTGGFAVNAAAGGARSVHLVDLSAPAIATAERNIAHNRRLHEVRDCAVHSTVGDAFEVMDALGRRAARDADRFDLVVIDPPSFAMSQANVDRALRAYAKLTRLGVELLRPGGLLVQASCSSRVTADDFYATVLDAARRAGRPLHEVRRTGHAVDHPIGFPQGAYLKALFATASGRVAT